MNCNEIEKYLPFYPEEVDQEIKDQIDKHLTSCSKCQAILKSLNTYKEYTDHIKLVNTPERFENKVLERIFSEKKRKKNRVVQFGLAISSVAALFILFLLYFPSEEKTRNIIETNFALKVEKKGKGPAGSVDFNQINNRITKILSETGSEIAEKQNNSVTGYYDYIVLDIPNQNLIKFEDQFNQASSVPLTIPKKNQKTDESVLIKVYFEMVNFIPGNFDGDKKADMLIQFLSGKQKGKWFIYLNNKNSVFKKINTIKLGKDEFKYFGDNWLIAGDFNGDGFDDICLYNYNTRKGFTFDILINNKDFSFSEIPNSYSQSSFASEESFYQLMTGDTDGNGTDELLVMTKEKNNYYKIAVLNSNQIYDKIFLPDIESCNGTILAGDFNGDSYFDIMTKYISGNRYADTDIYLNNKNNGFDNPIDAGKSFQGDYLFFISDINGDGFDDLLVKEGGYFIPGKWHIMPQHNKDNFNFMRSFRLDYPQNKIE
jgi:hypothetical protein